MRKIKKERKKIKVNIVPNKQLDAAHKQFKLITKLKNGNKRALVTYKDMELIVMEGDKTVEKHKYVFGDVGLWKYSVAVKKYLGKGYEVEATISNANELFKKARKGNNEASTTV